MPGEFWRDGKGRRRGVSLSSTVLLIVSTEGLVEKVSISVLRVKLPTSGVSQVEVERDRPLPSPGFVDSRGTHKDSNTPLFCVSCAFSLAIGTIS